jgi:hypothetical protein
LFGEIRWLGGIWTIRRLIGANAIRVKKPTLRYQAWKDPEPVSFIANSLS